MPTLGLQGAPWSEDTPSAAWTGGHRCPGVTTTRTRTWRGEEVAREEEAGVWRGRGWEGAGRGGNKHARRAAAGRTAAPDPPVGAGGWEWGEEVGAGKGGEEAVEQVGAGRGGREVAEEEAVAVAEAGSGDKPAQEAGSAGRATAAGRGGTTTRWSRRPALMPTATW